MILGHEVELDHVVLGGLDALRGVDEAGGAADGDLGDGCQYVVLERSGSGDREGTYSVRCLWRPDRSVHLLGLRAAACVGRDDDDGVDDVHHGVGTAAVTIFVSLHVPVLAFGLGHLCAAHFLAGHLLATHLLAVHLLTLLSGLILLALLHHLARHT